MTDQEKLVEFFTLLTIRSKYGFMSWAIDNPEVGPILRQAAREGWDEARLSGAIQNTAWWKGTAESARQWQALKGSDPASAQRLLAEKRAEVDRLAGQLGIAVDPKRAAIIAEFAVAYKVAGDDLKAGIVAEKDHGAKVGPGVLADTVNKVRARAAEYLTPISAATANSWATKITIGTADQVGLDSYLVGLAKSRLPQFSREIDMGLTPAQIVEPYAQQTAQLLEVAPSKVNMLDAKFSPMIDTVDGSGQRRPMSLAEAASYTRGLSDWSGTRNGREAASGMAEKLLETFGAV